MEASANVETDLESVSTDKGNDKISETVCLDNDVEKSKIDVSESVECINNGDISDTDTCVGKNNQMEPVSTSKDIVNLNSAIASDKSDEIVDIPLELKDDINTDSHKDSENVYGVDDENLLEEIHSGEFAAVSSPSKENLNTSMQSVELLEEEQDIEEEEEVEEEEEEEEEKGQINDDDPTIILDDDDDDEDERNQRATDDESLTDEESDNEDEESQDITDRDDIDEFDDHKDDDLSTLSSEGDVEVISKVPEKKSLPLRHRNAKTIYKSLVKRSIRASEVLNALTYQGCTIQKNIVNMRITTKADILQSAF
ncbi:hypothetical protein Bhyg_00779 [Pseudolycoriella hygida]|uniref:Uncharacterized protein n=1 Tax=Pseudolycoriella hygida TaxID=35572 RepID=A0A9Q0N866_9DIPT|nr:hypothetical protein Bhyg_00779 [Pseudolycoriella hygida]